jgi:hypothetical protein
LNWADGDANPKWLEFVINDDGSGEADEYVELTLGNAVGTSVGQATLRINIADGTGINNSPNAVAGASQTVKSGVVVTLDGAQSNDPDGDAITYQWLQTSGTTVTLNNANTATASFAAPDVTSDTLLRFQLTVSDTRGLTNVSTTSVTVRKPGKSGGGGSMSWFLLVLSALVIVRWRGRLPERMLFDDRLLAVRTRRDNVHRHAG